MAAAPFQSCSSSSTVAAGAEETSTAVAEHQTAAGSTAEVVTGVTAHSASSSPGHSVLARTATPTENSSIRPVACRAGDVTEVEEQEVDTPPYAPSTVALRDLSANAPEGEPQAAGALALRVQAPFLPATSSQSALQEFMAAISTRFETTRLFLDESSPRLAHFAETLGRFESRPCA